MTAWPPPPPPDVPVRKYAGQPAGVWVVVAVIAGALVAMGLAGWYDDDPPATHPDAQVCATAEQRLFDHRDGLLELTNADRRTLVQFVVDCGRRGALD